ncbi:Homocysteine S-methyltransferase 2 [Sesamum angolense]|uniref:Homocysteine S-methyltransferase 2 n=1 Tax=Sesamum angolense TaxID=2727404 RepID=A0AAE2C331_9LAMI|nr:Homocysteine S-methyltransferase 2 [Sesamum angolense]
MGPAETVVMPSFLHQCGDVAVIDGGLATELERYGADLNDPLWSAKCLLTSPHLIRTVSPTFRASGLFVLLQIWILFALIIVVSLLVQNSAVSGSDALIVKGEKEKKLMRQLYRGLRTKVILWKKVKTCSERVLKLHVEARENYRRCREASTGHSLDNRVLKQRQILVAASGVMGLTLLMVQSIEFPPKEGKVLADSGPDLIAFETVPNKLEAQLLEEEEINIPAWLSFNSKDGVHVVSGDALPELLFAESSNKLLRIPEQGLGRVEWVQNTGVSDEDFVSYVNKWCEAGASLVGGCCRTTPNTIRAIYRTLTRRSVAPS